MRIAGKGAVIHGAEGASPPLAWVTVPRSEGEALIARGFALEAEDDEAPEALLGSSVHPALILIGADEMQLGAMVRAACGPISPSVWNGLPEEVRERLIEAAIIIARLTIGREASNAEPARISPVIEALHAPEPDPTTLAQLPEGGATPPPPPADEPDAALVAERAQHIADAIDLLEGDGIETEGDRVGKPNVDAVTAIAGFPVTAEEIDAALAAKESAV